MNVLSFDIEDWYNCDFISRNVDWNKFEVRIYEGVDRILQVLDETDTKATFFCLGWIAQNHPRVIKLINEQGHQIACHSYMHELSYRFDRLAFKIDTDKAKKLLEDVSGNPVNTFRAPGFSIKRENIWAFEILAELGFEYDSSVFPASHDYGGLPDFGTEDPFLIEVSSGLYIKEFPISSHSLFGKKIVFSGGGFFRFFPYLLIKKWTMNKSYNMTYFHPRDFDPNQPIISDLPLKRKFKSYIGLKHSFSKFNRYIKDFDFVNLAQADKMIYWSKTQIVKI